MSFVKDLEKPPSYFLSKELNALRNSFSKFISKNNIIEAQNSLNQAKALCSDEFVMACWAREAAKFTSYKCTAKVTTPVNKVKPLNLETYEYLKDSLLVYTQDPNTLTRIQSIGIFHKFCKGEIIIPSAEESSLFLEEFDEPTTVPSTTEETHILSAHVSLPPITVSPIPVPSTSETSLTVSEKVSISPIKFTKRTLEITPSNSPQKFPRKSIFAESNPYKFPVSEFNIPPKVTSINPLFDTHCHIQCITDDWDKFKLDNKNEIPSNYLGCVQIFHRPFEFSTTSYLFRQLQKDTQVYFAFGCHPKQASKFNHDAKSRLRDCLAISRCVALGEIGIDLSNQNCPPLDLQIKVFKYQVNLAQELNLPIIIHCRAQNDSDTQFGVNVDKILQDALVETKAQDIKIHLHCFRRTPERL